MGPKWPENTLLGTPRGPGSLLEKLVFDPFSAPFRSRKAPFLGLLGTFGGPKRVQMGSKRPEKTLLRTPNGPGSLLEKVVFWLFWTRFP